MEGQRIRSLYATYASTALSISLLALFLTPALQRTATADPPDPSPGLLLTPVVFDGGGDVSLCYTGCGGEIAPVVNADYEQQVVELVNAERADMGLPPLKRVTELENAARYYATDMGQDDYFAVVDHEHDTYDKIAGYHVWVCDAWTRIQSYYVQPEVARPSAENIAAGDPTPQRVMDFWMVIPEDRSNILSTYSWEIGVGYYTGEGWWSKLGGYWVQDFGRRSDVYPLIIDREAAKTNSRNVSLYIYGSWDEVRLRSDGPCVGCVHGSWSGWQPFQNTMNWTLGLGRGEHTVWAEMRKGGQSASSSDTIYLDASTPALGNIPDALRFVYSIPDQRILSASSQVTPKNIGGSETLTWSITAAGAWFTVAPLAGITPTSFRITPSAFSTSIVITYTGAVTVIVTDPTGVEGSPRAIDLTLRVVDSFISDVYFPLVARGYQP